VSVDFDTQRLPGVPLTFQTGVNRQVTRPGLTEIPYPHGVGPSTALTVPASLTALNQCPPVFGRAQSQPTIAELPGPSCSKCRPISVIVARRGASPAHSVIRGVSSPSESGSDIAAAAVGSPCQVPWTARAHSPQLTSRPGRSKSKLMSLTHFSGGSCRLPTRGGSCVGAGNRWGTCPGGLGVQVSGRCYCGRSLRV
jgi:hypothetical protein